MSNESERYGLNRNRWRRVYGRNRRKPRVVEYFDSGSQQTVKADLEKTFRHRDYFQIEGINRRKTLFELPTISIGEYEEGLIASDGVQTEFTASFDGTFSSAPFVVYTLEPNDVSSSNVNVFGIAIPSTTQMFVGISAPFSGNIRYRAAYSDTWPATVSSSYTASMIIFGGEIDVTNAVDYTASYTLPGGSVEFRATFYDSLANYEANVGFVQDSLSISQAIYSMGAESSGKIHFIAYSL